MDKYKNIPVYISLNHMELINSLNSAKRKSDKLTLFALIYYSQLFSNYNGVFSATFISLGKRTGIGEKSAERAINNLIALGYLEVIERNARIKGVHNCDKAPNKYRLLIELDKDNIIYTFGYCANIYIHFINCYTICYKELKFKNVTRWIRDSINKHLKEKKVACI
jgi:hypothetical protein